MTVLGTPQWQLGAPYWTAEPTLREHTVEVGVRVRVTILIRVGVRISAWVDRVSLRNRGRLSGLVSMRVSVRMQRGVLMYTAVGFVVAMSVLVSGVRI